MIRIIHVYGWLSDICQILLTNMIVQYEILDIYIALQFW